MAKGLQNSSTLWRLSEHDSGSFRGAAPTGRFQSEVFSRDDRAAVGQMRPAFARLSVRSFTDPANTVSVR